MENPYADNDPAVKAPVIGWFWLLTWLYVGIVIAGSAALGYFDSVRTRALYPEEWGNVLAGVFSPLAFLWLIYASLLQRSELALQRRDMKDNNRTQAEQKEAMEKQVAALKAQSALLQAQADAAYEPIFVVHTLTGKVETDSFVLLTITNLGGGVTDVKALSNGRIDRVWLKDDGFATNVRGVVPYWPSGGKIRISLDVGNKGVRKNSFSLKYRRLDNTVRKKSYTLHESGLRLQASQNSAVDELEQPHGE